LPSSTVPEVPFGGTQNAHEITRQQVVATRSERHVWCYAEFELGICAAIDREEANTGSDS
jgi:hypothetical protein